MRIVIDLDGTICEIKDPSLTFEAYTDVKPLVGAVETLQKLKETGHHIIIYTSRHMKTCNGDVEMVKRKVGQLTQGWLKRYSIYYDELYFGKPYGHVYIDDLAIPFQGWGKLPQSLFKIDKK